MVVHSGEFETSLVYRENTRTSRDTQNNSVSKNQIKEITREGCSFLFISKHEGLHLYVKQISIQSTCFECLGRVQAFFASKTLPQSAMIRV